MVAPRGYAPVPLLGAGLGDGAGDSHETSWRPLGSVVWVSLAAVSVVLSVAALWVRPPHVRQALRRGIGLISLDEGLEMPTGSLAEFFAVDLDEDGTLSWAEFQNFTSRSHPPLTDKETAYVFRGFDADHDEAVSLKEFLGSLRIGRLYGRADDIQQIIETLEAKPEQKARIEAAADGGEMTFGEFRDRLKAGATARELMRSLDQDGDGHVSLGELLGESAILQPPLTRKEAEYVMRGLDADGDGTASMLEMVGAFKLGHFFQRAAALSQFEAYVTTLTTTATSLMSTPTSSRTQPPINFESFRARIQEPVPVVFARMDADGDGFVSHGEFLDWSQGCSPPLSDSEAEYAFLGLDANHDRWLSPPEFAAALSAGSFSRGEVEPSEGTLTVGELRRRIGLSPFAPPGAAMGDAANVVRDVDVSGDGLVDLCEFTDAAAHFAVPMTPAQAQYAFTRIDENGDGWLSTQELEHVFSMGRFSLPGENSLAPQYGF